MILEVFAYSFICKVTTAKVIFRFYRKCVHAASCHISERATFTQIGSIDF